MGKIRRSGYIFVWLLADHAPPHLHIFKNGKLICKWRLDLNIEMSGKASKHLKTTIETLKKEGHFMQLLEQFK